MHKPRVFLDSSVIIAALLSQRGASYYILTQSFDVLDLEINEYVFEEVRRSLERKFKNQPTLTSNLFSIIGLSSITIMQNPNTREVRVAEKLISTKDASILASVLKRSGYLLTLDNEFFKPAIIDAARERDLTILKPGALIRLLDL